MTELNDLDLIRMFNDAFEALWMNLELEYPNYEILKHKTLIKTIWMDGANSGMEYAIRTARGEIKLKKENDDGRTRNQ